MTKTPSREESIKMLAEAISNAMEEIAGYKRELYWSEYQYEVLEAEMVVAGLPGSNDRERKANLTVMMDRSPQAISMRADQQRLKFEIGRLETYIAYNRVLTLLYKGGE